MITKKSSTRYPYLCIPTISPVGDAVDATHWVDGRPASSREHCVVGCERHRPVSTSRSKMAVSVFRGVRLLSIGDANGDIQRHSEQQPLRLEVKTSPDAALINLSNAGRRWTER
ncbi:hypothetical protein AMECASPLE_021958 [Ameca splendens]|uniref:FHA domain-containing protein n=1 Tax=Ameca splendens TaxID=208324 RepID=A0ABV0YQK1_9TELE